MNKPQTTMQIILKYKHEWGVSDEDSMWILESLNSARMKFILKHRHSNDKKIHDLWRNSESYVYDDWLVESVMSGMFDEIICKEMD